MQKKTLVLLIALAGLPFSATAQTGSAAQSAEPFKVGTFGINGDETVGIVLRDQFVIDLEAANAAMEAT